MTPTRKNLALGSVCEDRESVGRVQVTVCLQENNLSLIFTKSDLSMFSVCAFVSIGVTCPYFGPLCPSCLNMLRTKAFIQFLLILFLPSSSFPPSFSSPEFFASLFYHPSITTSPRTHPPLLAPLLYFPCTHWSYCCNRLSLPPFSLPTAPPNLLPSSYSFSDSPGKTCWLSQPRTPTMIHSLLSRQQRTQPHQFHPFKRMKEPRLKESRERMTFFQYGECSSNTKVALLLRGGVGG